MDQEPRAAGDAPEPQVETKGQQLDVLDKLFQKGDRIGPTAALIDATILLIGIVIALVWQASLSTHHKAVSQTQQWHPTQLAASQVATTQAPPTPKVVTKTICAAFVTTHFKSGKTHSVEYKGTCSYLHSMFDGSKEPVHWLPPRTVTYMQTGS